jgi:hypothetical protein
MNISDREQVTQLEEKPMKRRDFLQTLAGGSLMLLIPARISAQVLKPGNNVALKCLGNANGPRWLDGRTGNGTVGLAPNLSKQYSGTKWLVVRAGEGVVALKCLGVVDGPRWLDGRTANSTVGLAPNTGSQFSGIRWQIVQLDANNPNIVALKCLGKIDGPKWLDGRTGNGTVGLAPRTDPPFTGTRWEVQPYPGRFDE